MIGLNDFPTKIVKGTITEYIDLANRLAVM